MVGGGGGGAIGYMTTKFEGGGYNGKDPNILQHPNLPSLHFSNSFTF